MARPVVGAYASAPTTGRRAGGARGAKFGAKGRRGRCTNRQNFGFLVGERLVAGAEVISFDLGIRDDEPENRRNP